MAKFAELTVQLELQQAAFAKGMDQAAKQLAKVQREAKQSQGALAGMEKGFSGIGSAVARLGAAFSVFKGVEAIVKAADLIKGLQGSFTALLGDAGRAGNMMSRLFDIVDRTGAPLKETGDALARLSIAMQPLGASNQQIGQLTENFIKLGAIGRSSSEQVANALNQLAQGLASGALGGDELKSIRENVPLVAQAIADGMGVSVGELKKLGEEGKLTADVVANSLLKATAKVNAAFAGLPVTFDQATNKMNAAFTNFLAEFDTATGISEKLVIVVEYIANIFKRWHSELVVSRDTLTQLQTLMEGVSGIATLIAKGFVYITAGIEMSVKFLGHFIQLAQALAKWDGQSAIDSFMTMADTIDAITRNAERAIAALNGLREVKPEMFGPPVPPDLLKPKPGAGAGAGGGGKGGKSEAEREAEALKKQGEALAAMLDPLNAYNQKMAELNKLLAAGAIGSVTYSRALEKYKEELTAAGDALTASVDPAFAYELKMRDINKAYRDGAIEIETWIKLQEKAKEEMEKAKGKSKWETLAEDLTKDVGQGIGQFFEDILNGSLTAEQAFSKMVKSIIADIAKLLAELAAAEAAKYIIKTIFGSAGGSAAGGKSAGTASVAAPAFNAARSLGLAATPMAGASGESLTVGTMGASGGTGPWNVIINNNAPVDVSTRGRPDGGLEVTIERVKASLASDVARGGNPFSRSLESAYALGRGR